MKTRVGLKILICLLAVAVILTAPIAFPLWSSFEGGFAQGDYQITTGEFQGEYSDNPVDNIPSFVPPHIVAILEDLADIKSPDIIGAMVDSIVNIYQYQNFDNDVFVAATAEELFSSGDPGITTGDYLIFTTGTGSSMEVVIVHIIDAGSVDLNSADRLFAAIEQSWTGINKISAMWLRGTLYSSFHAPLEYGGDLYLNINDGDRYSPPPQTASGTWFLITSDLEYSAFNPVYPQGHIAKSQGQYYIANTAVWNTAPSSSVSWAWSAVNVWSGGSVSSGTTVYTDEGGSVRFWRALRNTSTAPSEQSARSGDWQEVKNAWIGRRGDMVTKSYYFEHNTYSAGNIVVFGVSPNLRYQYFRARGNVPAGQLPLVRDEQTGILELNSVYWESWT